ncbi:M3 family metallopeptidase [Adhaeribacter pallidiroseus]|uniref:Peptidyl-dipeptidase Dcp n=1 Tax=Adhaeribacter pallidiroseus TaxID=2072847 RepID=A0A369QHW2_9BACT|nr:M3 family metallopeptidase [Adhaeribacter pallidiroseus]RDC62816.1 Peptidyl-dipeptidase Dcp [Adhaeribacter pallidiroseus]
MNPLLEDFNTLFDTAPFHSIRHSHYLPAIQKALHIGKSEINQITSNPAPPTFENTILALEQSGQLLDRISSIFFNLNAAETDLELQHLAKEISPLLTAYANDIMLDEVLFKRINQVYQVRSELILTVEDVTLLEKTYKSFIRNGANLSETDKVRLRELDNQLSQLSLTFGENVLHETNDYSLEIKNTADLAGLPESLVEAAAQTAKETGKENSWLFTLHLPSYIPFMTYADNRELRQQLYWAYATRACQDNTYNNEAVVLKIVQLRLERAQLLGFKTHADFVLQERMAQTPGKVQLFLEDLLIHAKPVAQTEWQSLTDYAQQINGPEQLQRWDLSYYAEKWKKEKFAIDDEILKPYFQLEKVMEGVFAVSHKLYGLVYKENTTIQTYHPDVKVYEVEDENGQHIGIFYCDFFPRPGKRNGAWMTSYRSQKKEKEKDQRPHVAIVCNFTKPTPTKPALLTFNEVRTLFHEFGHALHGLLANGTYASLSGTHVYWDFVELPSQVFENWTTEKESLDLFARHYQTGEVIPDELIQRIKQSTNFMAGYATLRQIGLARLDLAWHNIESVELIPDVFTFEKNVLVETEILPLVPGTNTSCSFSHIFQGGYSSGYYSYKWAEVLDADAFEFFQEKGVFNKQTANLFKKHILSAGGSEPPMILYKRFRGQEPSPKALLKRTGLLKD